LKSMSRILALAFVASMSMALVAQDAAKPAPKASASDSPSRWDIFAGYSFFAPHDTVNVLQQDGVTILPIPFKSARVGTTESLSYYFDKHFGLQLDSGQHDRYIDTGDDNCCYSDSGILTIQGGPVMRFPGENLTAFVHALGGTAEVHGPEHEPYKWGATVTAGGGIDYKTSWFNHHLSLRIAQVDYEYIHADYGPGIWQGKVNMNGIRLSAGVVFSKGQLAPPPAVTISCSASPASIFPGDPVSLTAVAGNLDPKLNAIYSWAGTGVTGTGTTGSVATASLAPGTYTVKCGVKEGKPGKEGLKPWESADSSTSFTVKAYEPPTISCSANPSTIKPGETSTVTAMGMSPQNRPLTYSYLASAGTVSGSGTSAVFSSNGAPTGTTGITCTVSDDKGQTATAHTSVTITAPYIPPVPHVQALCSIGFSNDKKRPTRVDNEAKACLDEVALDLQKQSDAKAVVVGDSTAAEKALPKHAKKHAKLEDFAGERAVNTKEYLVTEKGIDASRISVATGSTDEQKVEDYLVPSGASFSADVAGTTPVDETVVKPQVRKPLATKPVAKKKAAKAAK